MFFDESISSSLFSTDREDPGGGNPFGKAESGGFSFRWPFLGLPYEPGLYPGASGGLAKVEALSKQVQTALVPNELPPAPAPSELPGLTTLAAAGQTSTANSWPNRQSLRLLLRQQISNIRSRSAATNYLPQLVRCLDVLLASNTIRSPRRRGGGLGVVPAKPRR